MNRLRTDWTTRAAAYAAGYRLEEAEPGPDGRNRTAHRLTRLEAIQAARSWNRAAGEHCHTSYYGLELILRTRAYWLGVARRKGELEELERRHRISATASRLSAPIVAAG